MNDGTVVRTGRQLSVIILLVVTFALSSPGQTITPEMKRKAESGDAAAQLALANAYLKRQNDDLAFKWFRVAAGQGNAEAQTQVGYMYRNGVGVEQDKPASVEWYKKAAAQGNATARFNLAVAYYNGDGVGIDDRLAYAWFVLAQESGDNRAGEAVTRTESEHTRAWVDKSKFNLAQMVDKGVAVSPDPAWAAKQYQNLSEDAGTDLDIKMRSTVRLGLLFAQGRGVPRNIDEALKRCEFAAKRNSAAGHACVGYLHLSQLPGAPNYEQAARSYREAVRIGDASSMFMLGRFYESGQGVKQDVITAYACYRYAGMNGEHRGTEERDRLAATMKKSEIKKAEGRSCVK